MEEKLKQNYTKVREKQDNKIKRFVTRDYHVAAGEGG